MSTWMEKLRKGLRNPRMALFVLLPRRFWDALSDKAFLKFEYRARIGEKLDLKNPKTFNEKLQWLKLYYRQPRLVQLVDKVAVRDWVAQTIGEEYLVPAIGVWESPEEIDFEALPEKFVLKCNHNSGLGMCICTDKAKLNIPEVKAGLQKGLGQNYYLHGREWPYKNVPRRILGEAFLEDPAGDLKDYKFMCFNGEVKCSFVCSDRFSGKGLHVTFFDRDWQVMDFTRSYPRVAEGFPKPQSYEEMVHLAQTLSQGLPFVRVDFYELAGRIYFGEMTFFPGNGMEAFQPASWDATLGGWITLPEKEL